MRSLIDKAQHRIKRIEENLTRTPIYRYPGQKYFYIMGVTKGGHVVALGPFMLESEASAQLAGLDDRRYKLCGRVRREYGKWHMEG